MLNAKKLEEQMETSKISKSKLCSRVHIARTTLDAILNGGDAKISTIEAIANELNINIGFLFDEEEKIQIRKAGRDYVEKGKIEHKGNENHNVSSKQDSGLEIENAELKKELYETKQKLITAQERIIELMDKLTQ